MTKAKSRIILISVGLLALALVACRPSFGQTVANPPGNETSQPAKEQSPVSVSYTGHFSLSPSAGLVGTAVQAKGNGFAPNTKLEIAWQTFHGSWKVGDGEFHGREFKDKLAPITTAETDANGQFEAIFTVPDGFGWTHDVVVIKDGVIQNKAGFQVKMQASLSSSSGPVGTPITIDLRGIGWRPLENSWVLMYDNKFTGWLSSVTTDGVAQAVIPAAGTAGKHIIQIVHGSFTFPYLNMQQSPQPDRPSWTFEFTVTDGEAVMPSPAAGQSLAIGPGTEPTGPGPALWTNPASGPVGTPLILRGKGLPPNEQVELLWFRVKGNRVSGQGWEEDSTLLGRIAAGANGGIEFRFQAPDDLGGPHRIEARINGEKAAETAFTITPSAFAIEPSSGPVGTDITIHLKGVGWTETANIYNVVYDNGYLGYACGFNSQGDVTIHLPAADSPGWHFIDLYPGIYKGDDMSQVNNFRIPQLTSKDDHPGERLPAFHFAFLITGEGS